MPPVGGTGFARYNGQPLMIKQGHFGFRNHMNKTTLAPRTTWLRSLSQLFLIPALIFALAACGSAKQFDETEGWSPARLYEEAQGGYKRPGPAFGTQAGRPGPQGGRACDRHALLDA